MDVFQIFYVALFAVPVLCVIGLIFALLVTARKARADKAFGWKKIVPLLIFSLLIVVCIVLIKWQVF